MLNRKFAKRSIHSVALRRLGLAALLCLGTTASAADLTVSNSNDAGAGSFRQAILEAQPNDRILFDSSLAGQTIILTPPLGSFSPALTIDGSAAPGLTIEGADLSNSAAGQLNLIGDVAFEGATLTSDVGIGAGGNLNLITGTIDGGAALTDGGALTSSGTITGDVSIAKDSRLIINDSGTVSGETTLDAGGTLIGNGTLDGNTTSSGTINAGTAGTVDQLKFGSDLTIDAGLIQVDINADNNGGTVKGVNNDLYSVTGNAVLNGGYVEINAQPGAYTDGAIYEFLNATSVTDTFSGVSDNMAFYDATLLYDVAGTVRFRFDDNEKDFADVGISCNQVSVGGYLDSIQAAVPTGSDLESVIQSLRGSTIASAQTGLDTLGGQIYASLPTIQLQHTSFSLAMLRDQLIFDRFYRQPDEQTRGWVRGYGIGGDANLDDCGTHGFDYALGGTEIVLQRGFGNGLEMGLFTNLAWSKVETDVISQQADVDSYQYGASMQYGGERGYLLGIAGGGNQRYKASRKIADPAGLLDRTASSKFDGSQAFGSLEYGTLFQHGPVSWIPHFAMQYIAVDQDEIRETGAESVNLIGNAIDADSLRSTLGLSVQQTGLTSHGQATTKLRVGWMHEYLDTEQHFVSHFAAGDSGTLASVRGNDLGRDWAVIGLNLQLSLLQNFTTILAYQGQVNRTQSLHTGAAGLETRW